MHRHTASLPMKVMLIAGCMTALAITPVLNTRSVHAATSTTVAPLTDAGFESGPAQTAWTETQSSGGELIDTIDPHTGSWAADLCNIDNCNDGHGNAGDTLVQSLVSPGQVTSATLSYYYNVATSEPDQNVSCKDWLTVGLGVGRVTNTSTTRRYCASTGAAYRFDSFDVTSFLNSHGGQSVDAQIEGFTNGLNPSEFLVDDVTLTISYLITPSAPVVAPVADCSVGQTTVTWSAPRFPLGTGWPVQSYRVTPYSVGGVAQTSTTVPGTQTSLAESLNGGTTCYFTVTATNANGTGPAGSPLTPVAAVTPLSTPTSSGFTLHWSLQPASAPATSYTVFIRDGSGPWLTWGTTTATTSMVYGTPGHTYHYYVRGSNAAGSGPAPSGNGQTTVTVPLSAPLATGFKGLYGVDHFGALHPAGSPPLVQSAPFTWSIVRGVAVQASGAGGYMLDGWGGVHAFGSAPAITVSSTAYWSGWDIARGIALRSNGVSGYVVDGYGGVHPFGGAPAVRTSAYWSGWDIARGITVDPSGAGGYVLDGWGGIHAFGDAKPMTASAYWSGWDIARGIVLRADGSGGYVLDGYGGIHPFGSAPSLRITRYFSGWDIARGLALLPNGTGGYVLDGWGGFQPFGSVTAYAGTPNYAGMDIMRGVAGA
jgi:hypothetical protein